MIRDKDFHLLKLAVAGLIDSSRRLERAIEMDNMDDRRRYLDEAAKKRETATQALLAIEA